MGKQKNLLNRFLTGTASDEETKNVETWLDELSQDSNPWTGLSEAEKSVFLKILKEKIEVSKRKNKPGLNKHAGWLWLVAASVIIMLMIPVYVVWIKPSAQLVTKVAVHKVVETQTGEVKKLQLADGSTVWLNAQSALRYIDSFDSHSRDVYLEGQAYFEIARDSKRPFVVHASSLQVTVLGTRFDISDYTEDGDAAVSVLSGKVAVGAMEGQRAPAILDPGESLAYDKHSHSVSRGAFSVSERPGWVEGEVVFYHTKMAQVAGYIKRNYGRTLTFGNRAISEMELSGNFGKIEDVKDLLEIICLTINAQYKTNGKNILITQMH